MANKQDEFVRVEDLQVFFKSGKGLKKNIIKAVNGVSFTLNKGETLALVGESGCGKTTTGKAMLGLIPPTGGKVLFQNRDLAAMKTNELRLMRKDMQFIFQDPYSSLNPRMKVEKTIRRPLEIYGIGENRKERDERVYDLLSQVGLTREQADRFPHEFSGGQRQRISIARALVTDPSLIVADEPTSALDVSIQCQILDLLIGLKDKLNLTMLFVSHDLSVVNYITDRTVIMYLGSVVETGPTRELFKTPIHPYSKALLEAIPRKSGVTARPNRLSGDISSSRDTGKGCILCDRCPHVTDRCREQRPPLQDAGSGRQVACWKAEEL